MKGQRLFVRETTPDDAEELAGFYRAQSAEAPAGTIGAHGLLGRLVGSPVAHMTWEIEGGVARITHVLVTETFRGKRIGRALLIEATAIARQKRIERLIVAGDCPARGFFLRTGFAPLGGSLVLEVR